MGFEKLNPKQKQKKTEITLLYNFSKGQKNLIEVTSERSGNEEAMETASTTSLEFTVSEEGQGLLSSNSASVQSLKKIG